MRSKQWTAFVLPVALCIIASSGSAQGKGKGYGEAKPQRSQSRAENKPQRAKPDQDRGRERAARAQERSDDRRAEKLTGRENARAQREQREAGGDVERVKIDRPGRNRFVRVIAINDVRPNVRRFVVSNRLREIVVGGAVAHAFLRGVDDDALVIAPTDRVVLLRNKKGDVLVDLDDDRARSLGAWRVVALDDRVREGAPSFCRSGAGHPVWGRQWCIDKGFGLGVERDLRWGKAIDPDRIIFRETTEQQLTREVLRQVLGDVAFNRLAVHAITLGLVDPLTGLWLGEATGPRVLVINSGNRPIAEVIDVNRDNRAETVFVALRPW
jgi:hypothetical protein